MNDDSIGLYLRNAAVPREAIATTLALENPEVRKLVVGGVDGIPEGCIGYYLRPDCSRAKLSSKEINHSMLIFDLMRKEHLLQGQHIMDYPIHEAVKDATNSLREDFSYQSGYPNGLGYRGVSCSLRGAYGDGSPVSKVSYVYIPDLYVFEQSEDTKQQTESIHSWMRICAGKYGVRYITYGLYPLNKISGRWGARFGAFLQDKLFEVVV